MLFSVGVTQILGSKDLTSLFSPIRNTTSELVLKKTISLAQKKKTISVLVVV
jgi:hypothetical protein